MNPQYASFARWLRFLCFGLTSTVSALYIAVVGFHHEILPTSLMISFTTEQANMPLPAAVECFMVLLMFDILREAGVRMPNHVGQAMSIVGALVIGQSAVEAGLVGAPVVIVVALTGITLLLVPRLTTAGLLARYLCLFLASSLGLMGLMIGCSLTLVQILKLESFGVPYVLNPKKLALQEVKDTFVRVPWPLMLTRISPFTSNQRRQKPYRRRSGSPQ